MQRLEKRLGKERILYMDEAGMLAGDVYRWGWSEKGRRKYGQRSGKRQKLNRPKIIEGRMDWIRRLCLIRLFGDSTPLQILLAECSRWNSAVGAG